MYVRKGLSGVCSGAADVVDGGRGQQRWGNRVNKKRVLKFVGETSVRISMRPENVVATEFDEVLDQRKDGQASRSFAS